MLERIVKVIPFIVKIKTISDQQKNVSGVGVADGKILIKSSRKKWEMILTHHYLLMNIPQTVVYKYEVKLQI